jgi:hypothetical protein
LRHEAKSSLRNKRLKKNNAKVAGKQASPPRGARLLSVHVQVNRSGMSATAAAA